MHPVHTGRHWRRAAAAAGAVALAAASLLATTASASGAGGGSTTTSGSTTTTATTDTSPVNLSTRVDMAAGKARHGATVMAGDARFEVLAPDLIRLEYSPTASFLDTPTFNVLNRNFPVPRYRVTNRGGWLTIRTSGMALSYKLDSGPFSTANTHVHLFGKTAAGTSDVQPSWEWECTFGQVCQSGAATLAGNANIQTNHTGYVSPAGFIAGYDVPGDDATWSVLGAPAGPATLTIRYANSIGAIGGPAPRHMTVVVNGTSIPVTMPATASWNDWATITVPVTLTSGTNSVGVDCATGDDCNVNVDDISVTANGASAAPVEPAGALGGYIRSFDSANGTYSGSPTCTGAETNTTCQAPIPTEAQGLLDQSGWYLLDDTQTAVWTADGWVAPRPAGDIEDGYLFGYGENYRTALEDLAKLTGPAPLLPEYVFGNWFSRYYPYTTADYEDQLLPEFQSNGVSLDTLSVDTDWKSPSQWDGWEWNPALFPDPSSFLSWAKSNDIHVALNIHSSIATNDPEYSEAQTIAGNTLSCSNGECFWDWSQIPQAESNFALQQPYLDQGVSLWWLDWCCDASEVSMPGLTPDSWINHLYAQNMVDSGQRGFVLARIGASYENSNAGAYPAGPWADHRSAIAFTGDTWGTWNTLAMEAQLAADEGSIGVPYVSDDIGSFLGPPAGGANDPDDLYLRWLALGTFQPIMREHSNAGQNPRLPWEYDPPTQAAGDSFLQLRESLVPYMYTTAAQSSQTGLPMTQALYLDYPDQPAAYQNPTEYMLGSNMLVAPVTTPGSVATTSVWFPPGRWTDWFTGATFTGPSTQTLAVPLDRAPVFVKDGGIVPLQSSTGHAQTAGSAALTLRVFAGANGRYTMYDDAGTGLGYEHGQYTDTPITYTSGSRSSTVVIGAARGRYAGEPASRSYTAELVDVSVPDTVLLNHHPLPASRWSYDAGTHTLTVSVGTVATHRTAEITQIGGAPIQTGEPAATQLSINPSSSIVTTAGATTTVSATLANSGPGAVDNVSLALNAPSGWTVTPTTSTTASTVAAGSSLTASWSVTAPAGSSGQTEVAALSATASYMDPSTGETENVSAQQLPTPEITSVSPTTASVGQVVTITGVNFGATQGDSYIMFSDDGTNWGAPPDEATFQLDSWSDNRITFTIPSPSGGANNDEWAVVPGSTATVTVTTADGTSNTEDVTIGSG